MSSDPNFTPTGGLTDQRRRMVLKQMAALSAFAGSSFGGALAALAAPADRNATGAPYRALVCLYQYGGNDHANFLPPLDNQRYRTYASLRENLALERGTLHQLRPSMGSDPMLGLHPAAGRLAQLFQMGEAAAILNVGPLAVPTSKADWDTKRVPLPIQLFSHSDQQRAWFAAAPATLTNTGWLGRLADVLEPQFNAGTAVASTITTRGVELILQGNTARSFRLRDDGAPDVDARARLYGSTRNASAFEAMMTRPHPNVFARAVAAQNERSFRSGDAYRAAARRHALDLKTFPDTKLGIQLGNIAQAILSAGDLGHRRQVFFAGSGSWDFHNYLLDGQTERLTETDGAIAAFRDVMVQAGLWDSVTVFTAGDFGRALLGNGRGTDHGWGGHHFVLGGSVVGGQFVGRMPDIGLGTREDAGQGRLIPSLSMSQYAAELVRWLGASPDVIETVLPNLAHFDRTTLGLFRTA
ncbi:MAG: DUF1501 domain-containing protein [Alphaproteobacteria bacterium]